MTRPKKPVTSNVPEMAETVAEYLNFSTELLESANIPTARLDAVVLLEDCLAINRAILLAHPDQKLSYEQSNKLSLQLNQRAQHIPLAYIRGKTEFYGREFLINPDVLEPRPETETLIDLLVERVGREPIDLVDVGAGSGAIGITAKLELPQVTVLGTDIDPKCLKICRQNARRYNLQIRFIEGDLISPIVKLKQTFQVVTANLPYVPDDFRLNQAAANEPAQAIFGGPDGLSLYRRLFSQLESLGEKPRFVFTESLPTQHESLKNIASKHGYRLEKDQDFIQLFTI